MIIINFIFKYSTLLLCSAGYLIFLLLFLIANKRFWDRVGKDEEVVQCLKPISPAFSITTGRLSGTIPNRSNVPKSRDGFNG